MRDLCKYWARKVYFLESIFFTYLNCSVEVKEFDSFQVIYQFPGLPNVKTFIQHY